MSQIEVKEVSKRFGDVVALKNVNLKLDKGKLYALVGENGAGKTTTLNIIFGFIPPDTGKMFQKGEESKYDVLSSIRRGIILITQESSLIPTLNLVENTLITPLFEKYILAPYKKGKQMLESAKKKTKNEFKVDLKVDLEVECSKLGYSQIREAGILRSLCFDFDVILLDEPTYTLSKFGEEYLFQMMREFANRGATVVYTTHRFGEMLKYPDEIIVMKNGEIVLKKPVEEVTPDMLTYYMFGKPMSAIRTASRKTQYQHDTLLEVRDLWCRDDFGVDTVKGISFSLGKGEILGVVGTQDSGKKELLEAIFGLREVKKGSIKLAGKEISNLSIKERLSKMSFIPDKVEEGLNLDFKLYENLAPLQPLGGEFVKNFMIQEEILKEHAQKLRKEYDIEAPDVNFICRNLSGGNKKKVMVARALERDFVLLVVYQPASQLDLRSKFSVYDKLVKLADEGRSILISPEDISDVELICDKLMIMVDGKIAYLGIPISAEKMGRIIFQ